MHNSKEIMTTHSPTLASTLGQLKSSGYEVLPVKEEMRRNLMTKLADGSPLFPGIVGYEETVIPQVVNAILAKHDIILLGLRGQAKTRLARQLTSLLDEWTPIVKDSEINDNPFAPISFHAVTMVREMGDDTPIEWLYRSERYGEKLATPDVTIADIIGDIDPLKAAHQRLHYSHEGAIHFGIIPRCNRGIFTINELPDLQPRIQVGLFNVLEERDIQIRGFNIRIPLDVMVVFTANPEDYTNRGNIITPLKDRIASQILTHYPLSIENAITITEQEAWTSATGRKALLSHIISKK
jgi:magnesium chelatase subunit I